MRLTSGGQKKRIFKMAPTPRVTKTWRLQPKEKSPAGMELRKEMTSPVNGWPLCPPCVCPEGVRSQS